MKIIYENELRALESWISYANSGLSVAGAVTTDPVSANKTCYQINVVADGIKSEYPFYAAELKRISGNLFKGSTYGLVSLNNAAFGELFIIVRHIVQEPVDMAIWQEIHPRIIKVSQELFGDGYFDSAAEKAIKEVDYESFSKN